MPFGMLPTIQELHHRTQQTADLEGVAVDIRVPLILRTAMNMAISSKLKALPTSGQKDDYCWCDIFYQQNSANLENSLFHEHWKKCPKQNKVKLQMILADQKFATFPKVSI